MKIKIIDLFNKIYNNDNIPKKIIYNSRTWEYSEAYNDFIDENNNYSFVNFIYQYQDTYELLNTEVEIIEEDKKIEKFDIESETGQYKLGFKSCSYSLNDINYIMLSKLNELIDEVNKLKENK